jgi:hypothetical protein
MNMPTTIQHNEGHIENTYSWDGSKRRRRVLDQIGQLQSDERYFGDLVTENGLPSLILHADGYVDVSGIQPLFTYHLKDHLGNVRIVMQAGGSSGNLKQTNDYYPFGMAYTKNAADSEEESFARENKYKYNGKEEQPMPGKWLDYGARFYDAQQSKGAARTTADVLKTTCAVVKAAGYLGAIPTQGGSLALVPVGEAIEKTGNCRNYSVDLYQ